VDRLNESTAPSRDIGYRGGTSATPTSRPPGTRSHMALCALDLLAGHRTRGPPLSVRSCDDGLRSPAEGLCFAAQPARALQQAAKIDLSETSRSRPSREIALNGGTEESLAEFATDSQSAMYKIASRTAATQSRCGTAQTLNRGIVRLNQRHCQRNVHGSCVSAASRSYFGRVISTHLGLDDWFCPKHYAKPTGNDSIHFPSSLLG